MSGRALVVDDHIEMARVVAEFLTDLGWRCTTVDSGGAAIAALGADAFDVVITDLRMADIDGLDVLAAAHRVDPDLPVLVMTAFGAIDSAIEVMARGARHYLTKPVRLEELRLHVDRALGERRLRLDHAALRRAVDGGVGALVGRTAPMVALRALIERVAPSGAPVLIRGESGTGKELVARAIHAGGPRRDGPFVAVNCSALPEALLESELFGHARGAFTGAAGARAGLFVEAAGGTLLLDEIGDMAPGVQAKLLRVVQLGEVRAVGSDESRAIDVRLIAATHQDLEARIAAGQFRADLFYRLNVVPVLVPALRERGDDIPLLAAEFFARSRARNPHSPAQRLAPEVAHALMQDPWPGNVRELENLIERLVVIAAQPTIGVGDLAACRPSIARPAGLFTTTEPLRTLRELEDEYVAHVLARCDGNKTRAAEALGIDVSTLHRRLRRDG
ncbi:MAG: sigma-54-dependent Fis family transcriptional regulator [Myxococcales bacterium]|nr:sigma-54-dependent Fis family transcriptional regulator [Myxococcales bacterium]